MHDYGFYVEYGSVTCTMCCCVMHKPLKPKGLAVPLARAQHFGNKAEERPAHLDKNSLVGPESSERGRSSAPRESSRLASTAALAAGAPKHHERVISISSSFFSHLFSTFLTSSPASSPLPPPARPTCIDSPRADRVCHFRWRMCRQIAQAVEACEGSFLSRGRPSKN
jgi:hypothetical protein